jgi:hypothetical protein
MAAGVTTVDICVRLDHDFQVDALHADVDPDGVIDDLARRFARCSRRCAGRWRR